MSDPVAGFAAAMARIAPAGALGLAVSGGGDSMALLHLACNWARTQGRTLSVATVDHGLREGSRLEAAMVAQVCAGLGLPHTILHWYGWQGRGNLQEAAREGRLGLLADWAHRQELAAVALGHTRDDQAETLLLRLARGSGVEGLAAMRDAEPHHGALWLRPLLGESREALRAYLRLQGVAWVDDPSNDNPAFERVKARQALAALAGLGIEAEGLAQTAARLRLARDSLHWAAERAVRDLAQMDRGCVVIDRAGLDALPPDMARRIVAAALCHVSSQTHRPRLSALIAALHAERATLHGCLLATRKGTLRISREYQAVANLRVPLGQPWDQRWQMTPPAGIDVNGLDIGALGPKGLDLCKDARATGLPRTTLLASPAIWQDARLIAAPMAGFGADWQASVNFLRQDFFSKALSH
ncbi:MAG: tRNA lysidine(34) synthetase TilS [Roseinatronobacter sp.]